MSKPHSRSTRRVALLSLAAALGFAQSAAAAVPYQWIAKMYTEALGRAPEQTAWQSSVNHFLSAGCSAATLKTRGRDFYLSSEYSNIGYDNGARLLTLYRGVFNREPDANGFNFWMNELASGVSWSFVVDQFFDSSEFKNSLAPTICTGNPYYWDNEPPIDIPVSGAGFQGTQTQLQQALNAAGSGGTVLVAQQEVIRLTSQLFVPAGVTLATTGLPKPTSYAKMARLVRTSHFPGPAIRLGSGAKLRNIWVDGGRGKLGYLAGDSTGVQLDGGNGTTVTEARLSNPVGGTNLKALGTAEGKPCASAVISYNLIDAYASDHFSQWSDGLTIACENATVRNNQILDATDVGIVLFGAHPEVQRSDVFYNVIINSANSTYGGLVADGWMGSNTPSFVGASIYENTLWTSPVAHMDFVLSVGTRAWFLNAQDGHGISVTSNTTGFLNARANTGIGISGMDDAFVQNNTLNVTVVPVASCPSGQVVAAVSAGHASGTLPPYVDTDIHACIGH